MTIEVYAIDKFKDHKADMILHQTEIPSQEAAFAFTLLEKSSALLLVNPDGEDSAGRAKWKLLPVEDVVKRAFDLAEAAYKEMRDRQLWVAAPDISKLVKVLKND